MVDARPACDGCNRPMDAREYKDHDCPAYSDSIYKNPLDHKMRVANWKVPGAELSAKGGVLTGDAVVEAARSVNPAPLRFPWLLLAFVSGIVAALIWTFG